MAFQPTSFNSLHTDLIHIIGFHAGTTPLLGPPSGLVPLLSVSKRIHSVLNSESNPHLYSQLFRAKFDSLAIRRRFPVSSITARALTDELARRWRSLARIRKWATIPNENAWKYTARYRTRESREDLMTAYIMLTESDGYNALQLLRWAHLDEYLIRYRKHRFVDEHADSDMPSETEEKSLFFGVLWMLLDYPTLLTARFGSSANWQWLLTPYTIGTFAYKGFYAAWPHHHLPPPPSIANNVATTELTFASAIEVADNAITPRPLCSSVRNYLGFPLRFSPPLLSQMATLFHVVIYSQRPSYNPNVPYPTDEQLLEIARQAGGATTSSTLMTEDDIWRVTNSRIPYAPDHLQVNLNSILDSRRHDDDFYRHISCRDPYATGVQRYAPLMRPYRFTRGSLAGEWDGRFLIINRMLHQRVMSGEAGPLNILEEGNPLQNLQAWRIQEHHYKGPSKLPHGTELPKYYSLPGSGGRADEVKQRMLGAPVIAGNPMNAFLPPAFMRSHTRSMVWDGRHWHSGIDVRVNGQDDAFYKTWVPGNEDEDDEPFDPDFADNTISTIITGEAIALAPAYSSYAFTPMPPGSTLFGTVRKWDGLITLYVQSALSSEGTFLYRGYLFGGGQDPNWVGRWRDGASDVRVVGWEGSYVMAKRR
ncbi:hypothetical protein FRC02_006325 [Tulasnella sp. 418]|nr:hypothetical protein FRC02_006325 [Tulasnella sp. 418]